MTSLRNKVIDRVLNEIFQFVSREIAVEHNFSLVTPPPIAYTQGVVCRFFCCKEFWQIDLASIPRARRWLRSLQCPVGKHLFHLKRQDVQARLKYFGKNTFWPYRFAQSNYSTVYLLPLSQIIFAKFQFALGMGYFLATSLVLSYSSRRPLPESGFRQLVITPSFFFVHVTIVVLQPPYVTSPFWTQELY